MWRFRGRFRGGAKRKKPGRSRAFCRVLGKRPPLRLEPVENLVRPEPLQPLERTIEIMKVGGRDAADLIDRADVAVVEGVDDLCDVGSPFWQGDPDRAAGPSRRPGVELSQLCQPPSVVGG